MGIVYTYYNMEVYIKYGRILTCLKLNRYYKEIHYAMIIRKLSRELYKILEFEGLGYRF